MPVSAAHGTILRYRAGQSGDFEDVAYLADVQAPELRRESIDTTTHQSTSEESIPGVLKRYGNSTFTLLFDAADTEHAAILDSTEAGDIDGWNIVTPSGVRYGFVAFVTRWQPVTAMGDEALRVECEMDVTGEVWNTLPGQVVSDGYTKKARVAVLGAASLSAGELAQVGAAASRVWVIQPTAGDTQAGLIAELNKPGATLRFARDATNYIVGSIEEVVAVNTGNVARVQVTFFVAATTTGVVADDATGIEIEYA